VSRSSNFERRTKCFSLSRTFFLFLFSSPLLSFSLSYFHNNTIKQTSPAEAGEAGPGLRRRRRRRAAKGLWGRGRGRRQQRGQEEEEAIKQTKEGREGKWRMDEEGVVGRAACM